MKKDEIIEKLTEIRNKRNCNCSRAKVVERAWFDRAISEMKATDEDLLTFLERKQAEIPIKNDDTRTRYNVYGYAIAVVRKYGA